MVKRLPANRDLAAQLNAVREIAKEVFMLVNEGRASAMVSSASRDTSQPNEESAVQNPSGGGDEEERSPRRAIYDQRELDARVAWAKGLRGEAGVGVLAELQRARSLGPLRDLAVGGSSMEMDQLRKDFPNFVEVIDYVWGRVVLANMVSPPELRLPPMLLHGPPGTGKTEFSARLAKWLGVPVFEVDVATLETSFRLTGLDAGYSTGKPGLIWQALQGKSMSPVIVLDELDKRPDSTRDSGLSFLLAVLEPATATRFQDAYVGLPVDASQITWIATCNDLRTIEQPLRSRFRIFDIEAPTREQMRFVINSVFGSIRRRESWGRLFPEQLPDEVFRQLVDSPPRQVWQALEDACARAAIAGRRYLFAEDVVPWVVGSRRGIGFLADGPNADYTRKKQA